MLCRLDDANRRARGRRFIGNAGGGSTSTSASIMSSTSSEEPDSCPTRRSHALIPKGRLASPSNDRGVETGTSNAAAPDRPRGERPPRSTGHIGPGRAGLAPFHPVASKNTSVTGCAGASGNSHTIALQLNSEPSASRRSVALASSTMSSYWTSVLGSDASASVPCYSRQRRRFMQWVARARAESECPRHSAPHTASPTDCCAVAGTRAAT